MGGVQGQGVVSEVHDPYAINERCRSRPRIHPSTSNDVFLKKPRSNTQYTSASRLVLGANLQHQIGENRNRIVRFVLQWHLLYIRCLIPMEMEIRLTPHRDVPSGESFGYQLYTGRRSQSRRLAYRPWPCSIVCFPPIFTVWDASTFFVASGGINTCVPISICLILFFSCSAGPLQDGHAGWSLSIEMALRGGPRKDLSIPSPDPPSLDSVTISKEDGKYWEDYVCVCPLWSWVSPPWYVHSRCGHFLRY